MRTGYTGHITPAEWRWLTIVSIMLVLAAFLPFLWVLVIGLADSSWQFMGALHDYKHSATDLARIYQGTEDQWLVRFLHTPESQSGTFIQSLYVLLGQLSRLIALPPVVVFHVARIGASLFMYLALYQLGASIWMRLRTRRIFFVVAVASSGFGWLIVPLLGVANSPDIRYPQAFPFFSSLANVHYPLALACLALLASVIITVFRPGSTQLPSVENGGMTVFLTSLILAFVYPEAVIPVIIAFFICVVIAWRRERSSLRSKGLWLGWLAIPALPMMAYYVALLLYNDIVGEIWSQLNQIEPPLIPVFLMGLGLPLIIALPGLYRAVTKFEPDGDQFMVMWLVTMVVLIYLPVGIGMRFIAGIIIPVTYFATRSIEDFWFEYIPRRHRIRLLVAFLPIVGATNFFVLMLPIDPMRDGDFSDASGLLLERDYFEAFDWLERNTRSDDVVLTAPDVGLWLPVWTGARVVYGHPIETAAADMKERAVIDWYRQTDIDECADLLEGGVRYSGTYDVDYILLGPQERALGETVCFDLLTPVRQVNNVLIYTYDPELNQISAGDMP